MHRLRPSSATGKVKSAGDLTFLNLGQAASRTADVQAFSVPTDNGAIKASGVSKAYEGIATSSYDPACDCITDAAGTVYTADNSRGSFVNAAGVALPQGWQVNVGLSNYTRAFTDSSVSGPFLGILGWNFAFAILTVVTTFTAACWWRSR